MVEITPVEPEEVVVASENATDRSVSDPEPKPSEERLLDAEAIEAAAKTMERHTARAHLESLAQKLRRDAAALKRVEASRAKMEASSLSQGGETSAPEPSAAAVPSQAPIPTPPSRTAAASSVAHAAVSASAKYAPIDRFSFDAGGYNSEKVTVYVPLPGVGKISRDQITCDFTPTSFDLIIHDLEGKNFRLVKDNLDKDIDPTKSKYIVKADKIVLKLGKCKTEYGSFDHWSDLTSKKAKKKMANGKSEAENPSDSIMNLMKNMYDEGDDNMKRMIGETMMKQREGKLGDGMGGMDDLGGMGGMGGMGL